MTYVRNLKNHTDYLVEVLEKRGMCLESIEKIMTVLKPLKLKRGEFFSEAGKRINELGILIDGLLMAKYESNSSVDEIISRFYYSPRNIIVSSFESFHAGIKTNEAIQALENSYLVTIEKNDLEKLYLDVPEMNRIGRQFAEQSYIQALQRIRQLQCMSMNERVNNFYENYPELTNRIKIKHLCSYLGTNRNALSRIRKKAKK